MHRLFTSMGKYILICCFNVMIAPLAAQEFNGRLLDMSNKPIEGAHVYNLRSKAHAHTNEMGLFHINETVVGDSIRLGSLGFEPLKTIVTELDSMNVKTFILKESPMVLEGVSLSPKTDGLKVLSKIDLMVQPVGSSQDILQKVPGLIIGQHAGGGKAEQLFLRGFDIDHGTDIAIAVDQVPVNMVSHAHGQGYADLHFVIPETLEAIDFDKGPYRADKGNFATAGHVDFKTKQVLDRNTVQWEFGDFGWNRGLAMFNVLSNPAQNAYIATELLRFDGPFESSQYFSRYNLFGKYTVRSGENTVLSSTVSHFTSTWDASGQIPERAVADGTISRFGAIDDTEGGTTSRSTVNLAILKQLDANHMFKANAYLSAYDFDLFSNFTFFLEDPENGDQIRQRESRLLYGANTQFTSTIQLGGDALDLRLGSGFRADQVRDNELSRTLNRRTILERKQLGDVTETNVHGFVEASYPLGRLTISPGIRMDHFEFGYVDGLLDTYSNQRTKKSIWSPKLNFLYDHNDRLQLFLKSGIGFHSNDSRVSVARDGQEVLPSAQGLDLGGIYRPGSTWLVNAALWYLHLDQEFVYVGDAGIVEPSGRTERYGLDLGVRYQFTDWLYFHTDATLTKARSKEDPKGSNYIPLAPAVTLAGGLTIKEPHGFSGGIRYRFLGDRPANADYSIVAEGYLVMDLNANYDLGNGMILGIAVQNLFDTEWNETQFATVSQLRNEPLPVEEIHFTPGTPFFIKGTLRYQF